MACLDLSEHPRFVECEKTLFVFRARFSCWQKNPRWQFWERILKDLGARKRSKPKVVFVKKKAVLVSNYRFISRLRHMWFNTNSLYEWKSVPVNCLAGCDVTGWKSAYFSFQLAFQVAGLVLQHRRIDAFAAGRVCSEIGVMKSLFTHQKPETNVFATWTVGKWMVVECHQSSPVYPNMARKRLMATAHGKDVLQATVKKFW